MPEQQSVTASSLSWLLQIVASTDPQRTERMIRIAGPVTIGRTVDCAVVLSDPSVSRCHAHAEPVTDGIRIVDLGSDNGVFMNERRVVTAVVGRGDRCRIGSTIFTCAEDVGSDVASTGGNGVGTGGAVPTMPVASGRDGGWLDGEGELVTLGPHLPISLDDPAVVGYVLTGCLRVFTANATGTITTGGHLLAVDAGNVFFGLDLADAGLRVLAEGRPGTTIRLVAVKRWQELAADPTAQPLVLRLIDAWILKLSQALVANHPVRPEHGHSCRPGVALSCESGSTVTAAEGVAWVHVLPDAVSFDDMVTVGGSGGVTAFPLTPASWLRPLTEEFGDTPFVARATASLVGTFALWHGLVAFHRACVAGIRHERHLQVVDRANALADGQEHRVRANSRAQRELSSVADRPSRHVRSRSALDVRALCARVARERDEGHAPVDERVTGAALALGLHVRRIAPTARWWTEEHGPLFAFHDDTPVALLPAGRRRYAYVTATSESGQLVDENAARAMSECLWAVYRQPGESHRLWALVRFAADGVGSDLRWLLAMAMAIGCLGTLTPFVIGQIFDWAIPETDRSALLVFAVALIGAGLATSCFKFTEGIAVVRLQARASSALQAAVWSRMLELPLAFFRRFAAGDLADRAQGVEMIQALVSGAGVSAILGAISGVFVMGQMFLLSPGLALRATLLTIGFLAATALANLWQLRYQREELRLRGQVTGLVLNLLGGVSKIRLFGAEPHALYVWAERFAAQRRLGLKAGSIQTVMATCSAVYPLIASITLFAAVADTGSPSRSLLTAGDFIAFTVAFALFSTAMQGLTEASVRLLRGVPVYERLLPILQAEREVSLGSAMPIRLSGRIRLAHVSFRYSPDGPWIVHDVSLTIEPGEFVAFVGESGCGKSTLLRLLLGLETPTSGTILYDGQDLRSLDLRTFRRRVGTVLQASRVMPTDIYRNIVGGTSLSRAEAWTAAERAGLADDIRAMPMEMRTYVSEGGSTLSGGQRQRLMIARAIVNNPSILFLDEATSALDNVTQAKVSANLEAIGATRVVAAHRLSTVMNANQVLYLEAGAIKESGTVSELMARNGRFKQLAARQMC